MNVNNNGEVLAIMEFIKSANLKGNVEIAGEDEFLWDLGSVFLRFLIDDRTTVLYSHCKSRFFEIGHIHENICDVISLIQNINNKDKRVHIAVRLGGSSFGIEHKTKKKKKSWVFARHYYSEL